VVSAEGDLLGHVRSVRDFGAGDLLEVAPPAGESWWLPFTKETVPEVQVDRRTIIALRPDEVE
jgi:16S rRNA processing protein RimM